MSKIGLFLFMYVIPGLVTVVHAACSKADIEFYLEKGFTQEQITQLCAHTEKDAPAYQPYQQPIIIYQNAEEAPSKDGLTKEEREAVKTISDGLDVYDVKLAPNTLNYTRQVCINSTSSPDVHQRYRTCPKVHFTIARHGLSVASTSKRFLVGGPVQINLHGKIKKEVPGGFESYSIDVQDELERNFNWREKPNETNIPLQNDYPIHKVVDAFRSIAKVDDGTEPVAKVAEVEKETKNDVVEEPRTEEKKKRWWNPFD